MRNIFLEKSYTKCDGENSPRHFYENSKLNGSTVWHVMQFVFIKFLRRGLPKYTKTNMLITCFYLKWSFYGKQI